MRRVAMTVLGAVLALGPLALGGPAGSEVTPRGATAHTLGSLGDASRRATDAGQVDVLETAGYLDPVLVDFISGSIASATVCTALPSRRP